MNTLFQKHHGTPGHGVSGTDGSAGAQGNSVRFGFVNDFFDGETILLSTIVKMGRRSKKPIDWNSYLNAFQTGVANARNEVDSQLNYDMSVDIDKKYEWPANEGLTGLNVYTGRVSDSADIFGENSAYAKSMYDVNTDEAFGDAVFSKDSKDSSVASDDEYKLKVDSYQFHYIYDINVDSSSYNELYDYNTDSSGNLTSEPKWDIKIETAHIPFEVDEWVAKTSNRNFYADYPFKYSEVPVIMGRDTSGGDFMYVNDEYGTYASEYDLGVSKKVGSVYQQSWANKKYKDYSTVKALTESEYPSGMFPDAFVDEYGKTQFGFDLNYSDLKTAINDSTDPDTKFQDTLANKLKTYRDGLDDEAAGDLEDLDTFVNDYSYLITQFTENYRATVYNPAADVSVRWDSSTWKEVVVPTTLKSDIQPGNILYFYLDEAEFAKTRQVQYMAVVTEAMAGCSVDELVKASQLTDPFEYRYVFGDEANGRVQVYHKSEVLNTNNDVTYYSQSISNILSGLSQHSLLIASSCQSGPQYLQMYNGSQTLSIDSSIDTGLGVQKFIVDATTPLKSSCLMLSENSYLSNIEQTYAVYDQNVLLNPNGFVKSLDPEDLRVLQAVGKLNGKTVSFQTYRIKQQKTSYLVDADIYDDYVMGSLVCGDGSVYVYDVSGGASVYFDVSVYNSCFKYSDVTSDGEESFEIEVEPYEDIIDSWVSDLSVGDGQKVEVDFRYTFVPYIRRNYGGFAYFAQPSVLKWQCRDIYGSATVEYGFSSGDDDSDDSLVAADTTKNAVDMNFTGLAASAVESTLCTFSLLKPGHINSVQFNTEVFNLRNGQWQYRTSGAYAESWNSVKQEILTALTYQNTWMRMQPCYDVATPVADVSPYFYSLDSEGLVQWVDGTKKSYMITAEDNIPDITEYDAANGIEGRTVTTYTESDYMCTLNDSSGMAMTAAQEYSDMFNLAYCNPPECDLFAKLNAGLSLPSSSSRSVNAMVAYTLDGDDNEYVDTFKIMQPGFSDPRTVPQVSISIDKDMVTMESLNSVDNGVMSNQVVVEMDVNISDFSVDNWGKYVSSEDDVLLDVSIRMMPTDAEWTSNLQLDNPYTRSTVRIIPDDDAGSMANYVMFRTELTSDIEQGTGDYDFNMEVDHRIYAMISPAGSELGDSDVSVCRDSRGESVYVFMDSKVTQAISEQRYVYSGLYDDMMIGLKNLHMSDVDGTVKLRVMVEFGNPLPADIYLRFAVESIRVKYRNNSVWYTFTTSVDRTSSNDTYLKYTTDDGETYRFTTDPVHLFVNPISYTVCPDEEASLLTPLSGSVKKTCSEDTITVQTGFYMSDVYESLDLMDIPANTQRQYQWQDWNGLRVKRQSMQDNILSISVYGVDPASWSGSNGVTMFDVDAFSEARCSNSKLSDNQLLSVVYRSSIMQPKLRDGKYSFYINDYLYLKSKYDQYDNAMPVFINADAALPLRSDEMLDGVDIWNFEYSSAVGDDGDEHAFAGVVNRYGNGYMFLQDAVDQGQYVEDGTPNLVDVKAYNTVTAYDMCDSTTLSGPSSVDLYTPEQDKYFRVPLYDIRWECPSYTSDGTVEAKRLVSGFDYAIANMPSTGSYAMAHTDYINSMRSRLTNILDGKYSQDSSIMPYNLALEIYPRVGYNSDTDTINVFMLRMPTIGSDGPTEQSYIFSNRLYELTEGYPTLTPPYNI